MLDFRSLIFFLNICRIHTELNTLIFPEQTFNHIRAGALKFGKSARAFLLGKVFFNVIRAKDLEVSRSTT